MLPECVLRVGPSGCGKAHLLLNKILAVDKLGVYDYIFILCPTFSVNETYLCWNGTYDNCVFGVSIAADRLNAVINFILKLFDGDKVAVIIDDMSSGTEQHTNFNLVTYPAYSGRHHGISLYVLSQRLCSISTGIRDNATRVIFFSTHCKRSIKTLKDEFFGRLGEDEERLAILSLRRSGTHLDMDLITRKCYVKYG